MRQKTHEIDKGNQGDIGGQNALSVTSSVAAVIALYRGRSRKPLLRLLPHGALYRIEWPDIGLSDLVNITRAKAAALEWAGRQSGDDKLSWRSIPPHDLICCAPWPRARCRLLLTAPAR
jgi:hypothetical protein